jgi:hypothetical protein
VGSTLLFYSEWGEPPPLPPINAWPEAPPPSPILLHNVHKRKHLTKLVGGMFNGLVHFFIQTLATKPKRRMSTCCSACKGFILALGDEGDACSSFTLPYGCSRVCIRRRNADTKTYLLHHLVASNDRPPGAIRWAKLNHTISTPSHPHHVNKTTRL